MNIAEKLSQIAENEQRVYNAGYERGKSEGGELTPSEGLEFAESWNITWGYPSELVGFVGKGSCTDTEVIVPCAIPTGKSVSYIGSFDSNTFKEICCDISGVSKIYLPDTIKQLYGFKNAESLTYIKFGRYMSGLDPVVSYEGTHPSGVVLDFSKFELSRPPYLYDTAIPNSASKIIVPSHMVDTWKSATNWAVAKDKIEGV